MTVKGIDVASYQSATPGTSGLSFLFTKATQSTNYVNPRMASQASTGRKAGLVVGFYHFLVTGNVQAQAQYFVTEAASQAGDILACDWETDPSTGKHASCAEKDAFIKAVKKLRPDHRVVLYCNTSFWKSIDTTSYCGDGLWIADPNHAAGKPGITNPWTFHQYGISGTDVNVANFASKAALAAWATGGTPAPPKPPTPPEEDPMAGITKQDIYNAVWETDQIKAPEDASDYATNKSWQAQSYLTDTGARVRKLTGAVADLAKTVEGLSTTGLADTQVTAIAEAVASNPALVEALSESIADKLAARLQS